MIKKERTSFTARFWKELARSPPNRLRPGPRRQRRTPVASQPSRLSVHEHCFYKPSSCSMQAVTLASK